MISGRVTGFNHLPPARLSSIASPFRLYLAMRLAARVGVFAAGRQGTVWEAGLVKACISRIFVLIALACMMHVAAFGKDVERGILALRDGTPFFPIGLYGFPQGRQDDEIRDEACASGFNFLIGQTKEPGGFTRSFDIPGGPPDADAKTRRGSLMDLGHQGDLKRDLLLKLIEQAESTPGVIVLQGPDEPNDFPFGIRPGPTPDGLSVGAEIIRAKSKLPLWINFGPTGDHLGPDDFERLRPYLAVPDVVSVDIYPIGGGSDLQQSPFAERGPACVGVFTRNLVRMVSRHGVQQKPVWMVLQAFGWGDLARASKPPESWTGRPPSYDEIRFMTFDAIVNGAGGVIYWGAPFLPKVDPQATWKSLNAVASELQELLPILKTANQSADQFVSSSNRNLELSIRGVKSSPSLFITNTSGVEQSAALTFRPSQPKALRPLGRTRIGTSSPEFRLVLKPFEVAIFAVER